MVCGVAAFWNPALANASLYAFWELILANLFRSQLIGRLAKELAELVDVIGVGVDGTVGEVSQLHIFGHALDVRVESSLVRRHG